ncbi:DUF2254 domain-containing protein [Streptomyces sp. NPDC052043]|uniref:DUF2254 domain-containing protein n=1 Tax=Streptomyces sp. NPDC052043 TaxID=3365684 RepID=UPI0037CDCE4A
MTSGTWARRPLHGRPGHRVRGLRGPGAAAALVAGGVLLGWFLPRWERRLPLRGLGFDASTAQATLAAVAGSMITLAGFIVTAITLVVQTVQSMSPRLVAALGYFSRYLVLFGLLIGTAVYALVALSHVRGNSVPRLSVTVAITLVLIDAVVVLYLLASLRHAVTGGGLSRGVGQRLRTVIEHQHPPVTRTAALADPADDGNRQGTLLVTHRGRPSVVVSVNEGRITRLAAQNRLRIHLTHAVGDFVATGDLVARVKPEGAPVGPRMARRISACVRYGPSRTLEQDTSYGLRLLADIAVRALSPAINDPTTAVQALHQIEDALLRLAQRPLGPTWLLDAHGTPRVLHPAPQWPDLVSLALDETLLYGSSSPQTARRLQALLQRLRATAPPNRLPALTEREQALRRLIAEHLTDPLLMHLASQPDQQGLGSPSHTHGL